MTHGFGRARRDVAELLDEDEDGLSLLEYALFRVLVDLGADRPHGCKATTRRLADKLARDRSRVARALARLRELDLIAYDSTPGQRRPYRIRLGARGRVDDDLTAETPLGELGDLREALVAALGHGPATEDEERRWQKAERAFGLAGVTPAELPGIVKTYRAVHPNIAVTPLGLVGNLGRLRAGGRGRSSTPPCESCGTGGGRHTADCKFANAGEAGREEI